MKILIALAAAGLFATTHSEKCCEMKIAPAERGSAAVLWQPVRRARRLRQLRADDMSHPTPSHPHRTMLGVAAL